MKYVCIYTVMDGHRKNYNKLNGGQGIFIKNLKGETFELFLEIYFICRLHTASSLWV